jgi:hypothetical protein
VKWTPVSRYAQAWGNYRVAKVMTVGITGPEWRYETWRTAEPGNRDAWERFGPLYISADEAKQSVKEAHEKAKHETRPLTG